MQARNGSRWLPSIVRRDADWGRATLRYLTWPESALVSARIVLWFANRPMPIGDAPLSDGLCGGWLKDEYVVWGLVLACRALMDDEKTGGGLECEIAIAQLAGQRLTLRIMQHRFAWIAQRQLKGRLATARAWRISAEARSWHPHTTVSDFESTSGR